MYQIYQIDRMYQMHQLSRHCPDASRYAHVNKYVPVHVCLLGCCLNVIIASKDQWHLATQASEG